MNDLTKIAVFTVFAVLCVAVFYVLLCAVPVALRVYIAML